jgi:hypothetical protein
MYTVDDDDVVIELGNVPQSDVGAPLPVVVCDEHRVLLAYIASEPDPNWDGSYVNIVSTESEGLLIAIITFLSPLAHQFGPPNDEAFTGHPLYERGLRPYSACEIRCSSWIRALERMNAVHPYHKPSLFASCRHFIFAFHDSTFECVADDFEVAHFRGSIGTALQNMVEALRE